MDLEDDVESEESTPSHTEDEDTDTQSSRRSKYIIPFVFTFIRSRKRRRTSPENDEHGSYYNTSVARVVYDLASHLGKNNSDMLWFAVLGLTDQYIHKRIEEKHYAREVRYFKDQEASIEEEGSSQSNSNVNDAAFDARIIFSEEYH